MPLKEGFADCLYTKVTVQFSWRDRIRILFGKTAHCDVRTFTENLPGRCKSETNAWVEPVYQRLEPPMAFVEKRTV